MLLDEKMDEGGVRRCLYNSDDVLGLYDVVK